MDPLDPTSGLGAIPDLMPMLIGGVLTGLLVLVAVQSYFCWQLSKCLTAIPPRYRQRPPNAVWYVMIPVAGLLYTFSIYPGISRSYRAFFDSMGRTDVGDCGERLGQLVGVAWVCCALPIIGLLAIPLAMGLTYLFAQRISTLRGELPIEARAV